MRRHAARGATLVECAIALVISSVLLAAVYALLLSGWRLARSQMDLIALRQNVRAAAAVLRSELQGVSADAGDLVRMSDSALALRATRAFGFVCAPPAPGAVVLDDTTLSATRAVDPARDSALVFREGDPLTSDDDTWLHAGVAAVRGGRCAGGWGGTQLVLTGVSAQALAEVTPGAPVRTFEILEYRLYPDATGLVWFGVRGPSGAGWGPTSPVAGPLRPLGGLRFRFLDHAGRLAAVPGDVALVEASIIGQGPRTVASPGHGPGSATDSLTIRVAVRGSP